MSSLLPFRRPCQEYLNRVSAAGSRKTRLPQVVAAADAVIGEPRPRLSSPHLHCVPMLHHVTSVPSPHPHLPAATIDEVAVAKHVARKTAAEGSAAAKERKKMDESVAAIVDALHRKARTDRRTGGRADGRTGRALLQQS